MTETKLTIQDLRYTLNTIERLKKISRKLNKLFTDDCNFGETEKRTIKEQKLIDESNALAKDIGYKLYVQEDPRGCCLYLTEEGIDARNYNNGISLY